ncbi:MAG TPA: hypothetical protein PL133_01315 [Methylophilaceae bacterium]|nr:hypothetical protein [Methylophilaceae bacterium]HQC29373.1 hypothetical protein [Methylotenera sp.]
MSRKAMMIIGIQAFLIIVLFWLLVFYGKDEYEELGAELDEEVETRSLVAEHANADAGVATLVLPVALQKQSGLQFTRLQATTHQATSAAFGTVESIDSLVELRTRYFAALADGNVIRTNIASAEQNLQRLKLLNQDDKNVSDRVVQETEALLNSEKAKLGAASTSANGIRDNMRQFWGATLANWATQHTPNSAFEGLLQHRDVLIKVTLPFEVVPDKNTILSITPMGAVSQNVQAKFISEAALTDNTIQGKTYYYHAPAGNFRTNMRVSARLDTQGKVSTGVIVPHQAVVWYANQAWVYQKVGPEKFVRRLINTDVEIESEAISGWYNTVDIAENDEVVVSGAQLLLSEELKYQIQNENED